MTPFKNAYVVAELARGSLPRICDACGGLAGLGGVSVMDKPDADGTCREYALCHRCLEAYEAVAALEKT